MEIVVGKDVKNEGIENEGGGTGIYFEKSDLDALFISPSSMIEGFQVIVRW